MDNVDDVVLVMKPIVFFQPHVKSMERVLLYKENSPLSVDQVPQMTVDDRRDVKDRAHVLYMKVDVFPQMNHAQLLKTVISWESVDL